LSIEFLHRNWEARCECNDFGSFDLLFVARRLSFVGVERSARITMHPYIERCVAMIMQSPLERKSLLTLDEGTVMQTTKDHDL
jgi:hypothetical protein